MPVRAQKSITIALTCVMAVLLCLAQTASALAAKSPGKTASGNFFGDSNIYTGETLPESQQPQWEIAPVTTPTASGRQVWLSVDPIGEAGGMNLYAYCYGNPLNFYDSLGLCGESDGWHNSDGSINWGGYASLFTSALFNKLTSGEAWGRNLKQAASRPENWIAGFGMGGITNAVRSGAGAEVAGVVAANSETTLYRAVAKAELNAVKAGSYGSSPSMAGKYFALTQEGAETFANGAINTCEKMTVTSSKVPSSFLEQAYHFNDPGRAGAGLSVHFQEEFLPKLYEAMSPIKIHP